MIKEIKEGKMRKKRGYRGGGIVVVENLNIKVVTKKVISLTYLKRYTLFVGYQ